MSKPSYVYVTYIRSTPEKVWQALTDREISGQYWGCHSNVSTWAVGSKWEHQRTDAQRTVDIVGEVIESVPPKRLVFSWAAPSDATQPEKVSCVTFDIEVYKDDSVRLTVMHDRLEPGSKMERDISGGWPLVLSSLKSFLETGGGLPM